MSWRALALGALVAALLGAISTGDSVLADPASAQRPTGAGFELERSRVRPQAR